MLSNLGDSIFGGGANMADMMEALSETPRTYTCSSDSSVQGDGFIGSEIGHTLDSCKRCAH
jgi:hypothetical protein